MKNTIIVVAASVAAALLASAPTLAAEPKSAANFVEKVALSDMFEIESGKLAASQAEDGSVKSFGQKMVDAHSKTSQELKDLVGQEKIQAEFPTALDEKHQAKLDKLKEHSGAKFDRAYIRAQVNAHEKAVEVFDGYAKEGDNQQLQQWAQKTLPTIKEHLDEAKTLQSEVDKEKSAAAEEDTGDLRQAAAEDDEATRSDQADEAKAEGAEASFDYIERQQPNDWSAEALIGRTVENRNGDNLGEINNVIINEKGDVVAVTIGVGGFLGIGEKYIGVPFDALEFTTQEELDRTASRDEKEESAEEEREARFDSEHNDMRIVLDTTQDQLEAAPDFAWLDEQDSRSAEGESDMR